MRTVRSLPYRAEGRCLGGGGGGGGAVNKMTDRQVYNITLPQTSFAGGNKKAFQ